MNKYMMEPTMAQLSLADREVNHSILLPFANGDIARVTLSVYKAPKGQTRPIDAYVVTECEGDFTGAARRAAEAVYNLAQKRLPRIGQMVIGLDIQGLSPGSAPVTGESGGLSFAIAIAGELFNKKQPVAATGIISSSRQGKVDRVDGIAKKLTAAAEIIPCEGRILYPRDNHGEIPENVFRIAREKQITLHPVSSIAEAIYAAYGLELKNIKTKNRQGIMMSAAVIILIAAITLATAFFLSRNRRQPLSTEQSINAEKTETSNRGKSSAVSPSSVGESEKETIESPSQIPGGTEKNLKLPELTDPSAEKIPDNPPSPKPAEPFYPDTGFE